MFPREAIHDNPEFRHYRALAVKNIIPQVGGVYWVVMVAMLMFAGGAS